MGRSTEASFASTGLPRGGDSVGPALRVVGPIGSGELCAAFLCDDEALGRQVAIKMLRPDRANVIERAHAFLAIARAMARASSANVVTIYDLGLQEGLPWFSMEYVPGVDLAQHQADHGGRILLDPALKLAIGMLRGLESLHVLGLAHGAIGTRNVLVAPDGRVVLTDAGMAKVAIGSMRPMPSATVGFRPTHLVPLGIPTLEDEIRSDVHAVATLLYRIITGREPALDRRAGRVPAPSSLADVPPRIDAPLVDVLSSPESMLLDAHALRSTLERVARTRAGAFEAKRILVVDTDEERAGATEVALATALDADVRRTADPGTAAALARRVDLVVVDPDGFGPGALDLITQLVDSSRGIPVLVLTERLGGIELDLLRGLGVASCLFRPLDPPMLAAVADSIAREGASRRMRGSQP